MPAWALDAALAVAGEIACWRSSRDRRFRDDADPHDGEGTSDGHVING
jgi:hypothetical protein